MATNPRVLVLDQPPVGVDIGGKDGVSYEIIRRLAPRGVPLVLMISTTKSPRVLFIALHHRVLVMREGRLT